MYAVIIPSLGRKNFLNELLDSIKNQTLLPEEIIIIFDNNKECKYCENSINKKLNAKIIYTDKLTTPQKRNIGVNISKSENIIFSDDDDLWDTKKGELTVELLKKFQVICHAYSKFGHLNKDPKYNFGKTTKSVPFSSLIFGDNIFGGGSGIAAKREVFLSIPFNDNLYSEDYDWWIKVLLADIKVGYIPESLVQYRVHNENMTSNKKEIYLYNFKIFNKILIKSFILFVTFSTGYLRITIKIFLKIIRKALVFANYLLFFTAKR